MDFIFIKKMVRIIFLLFILLTLMHLIITFYGQIMIQIDDKYMIVIILWANNGTNNSLLTLMFMIVIILWVMLRRSNF